MPKKLYFIGTYVANNPHMSLTIHKLFLKSTLHCLDIYAIQFLSQTIDFPFYIFILLYILLVCDILSIFYKRFFSSN
jgi:hypothetical protein